MSTIDLYEEVHVVYRKPGWKMIELQKNWLVAAKRELSKKHPGLTWDTFADLGGIDRRAFKTYRMPEGSADYRKMPALVESAINNLLRAQSTEANPAPAALEEWTGLLVPALAAFVMRQARISLIEGRMIAGNTRSANVPVGLSSEDRKAMAMVSRACLRHGLPDHGSEVHHLLRCCTLPLAEWLDVPVVISQGLEFTRLIEGEDGIPTAEAEELATDFGNLTAGLEEQLFMKFMEVLARFPAAMANQYYTMVREMVVRHPVVNAEILKHLSEELPYQVWALLQQQFYEPVPEAWEINGAVPLCSACGNGMKKGRAGLVCRTVACCALMPASPGLNAPFHELIRATRGIRQYWIEPGIDEIRLFDALTAMGVPAELYPFRDRVDIAVADIGIDLKAYASPETLGKKFNRSIGGLTHYAKKWVVVPDWLTVSAPTYMDRLKRAADRDELRFLTVSGVIAHFRKNTTDA